jgi:hypothetical protein
MALSRILFAVLLVVGCTESKSPMTTEGLTLEVKRIPESTCEGGCNCAKESPGLKSVSFTPPDTLRVQATRAFTISVPELQASDLTAAYYLARPIQHSDPIKYTEVVLVLKERPREIEKAAACQFLLQLEFTLTGLKVPLLNSVRIE